VRIKQSVTGSPAPLMDISVTVRTVTTDSTANTGTQLYTPKPCVINPFTQCAQIHTNKHITT